MGENPKKSSCDDIAIGRSESISGQCSILPNGSQDEPLMSDEGFISPLIASLSAETNGAAKTGDGVAL